MTRILFFGVLKDIAGVAERRVELPSDVATREMLIDWLSADNPELRGALTQPGVRLCINKSIVSDNARFDEPEEAAFLPAFSGG